MVASAMLRWNRRPVDFQLTGSTRKACAALISPPGAFATMVTGPSVNAFSHIVNVPSAFVIAKGAPAGGEVCPASPSHTWTAPTPA